jgi:hypothetical protein
VLDCECFEGRICHERKGAALAQKCTFGSDLMLVSGGGGDGDGDGACACSSDT